MNGELAALFAVLTEMKVKRENAQGKRKADIEEEYIQDQQMMFVLGIDWVKPLLPELNSPAEDQWNRLVTQDHEHLIVRAIEVRAYVQAATLMLRFWHNVVSKKVEKPTQNDVKLWRSELGTQELTIPENAKNATSEEIQGLQRQLGVLAKIAGNASKDYIKIFLEVILKKASVNNLPMGLRDAIQDMEKTYAEATKYIEEHPNIKELSCSGAVKVLVALLHREEFTMLIDKSLSSTEVEGFARMVAPFAHIQDLANTASHWDFGLLSNQQILQKILEGLFVATSTGNPEIKGRAQRFFMNLVERVQKPSDLTWNIEKLQQWWDLWKGMAEVNPREWKKKPSTFTEDEYKEFMATVSMVDGLDSSRFSLRTFMDGISKGKAK
eukprot:gb/GEZN01002559.1/.p1 GENE.gb/GEZN01002559.1/~~gb/GEZN01002559.1/.p1  ORF type:complete len:382 (+),score=53.58 gb/GEZN01002559.1/:193-1338(+)